MYGAASAVKDAIACTTAALSALAGVVDEQAGVSTAARGSALTCTASGAAIDKAEKDAPAVAQVDPITLGVFDIKPAHPANPRATAPPTKKGAFRPHHLRTHGSNDLAIVNLSFNQ
jgi:hypothetical protein